MEYVRGVLLRLGFTQDQYVYSIKDLSICVLVAYDQIAIQHQGRCNILRYSEIEAMSANEIEDEIAAVCPKYYKYSRETIIDQMDEQWTAKYNALDTKHHALKAKYRKLKEHLEYMPGGPGALAAQEHFVSAQAHFEATTANNERAAN